MEPFGFSIFADDLRVEAGNKFSIMGVYGAELFFLQPLPQTLPKLSILVMYYQLAQLKTKSLEVQVFLPGDSDSPSISFPARTPEQDFETVPLDPDQEPILHLRLPVIIQPLVVTREGFIKVRLIRDDTIMRVGSLKLLYQSS
jgi:hypothetical protein